MIIWIASYPKSGNTWIRSLLTSYFFTTDGVFDFKLLDNIEQFSSSNLSSDDIEKTHYQDRISKNWIPSQRIINKDKKLRFFKTHNAMCTINKNSFTDKENTIAAIYIVRDPRNLILSLSHHYEMDINKSFDFITNKRKIIFPIKEKKHKNSDPDDFNFLSDWGTHYNSWKNIGFCPVKIIRYEDLLIDSRSSFISILNFIYKYLKSPIDEKKINNCLSSTSFTKLSSMEKKQGFVESVKSQKTKKKIKFFNKGRKNDWKKKLNSNIAKKIEIFYTKEMKELNYL